MKKNPEITKIFPKIATPGGAITIYGKNFDAWNSNKNYLNIDNQPCFIHGMSEKIIYTQIPMSCYNTTAKLQIQMNSEENLEYNLHILQSILPIKDLKIISNPIYDRKNHYVYFISENHDSNGFFTIFRINLISKIKEIYIQEMPDEPSDLILNEEGILYIASQKNGTIYHSKGINNFEIFSQGLGKISGLALSPKNEIYVANTKGNLYKIDKSGRAFFFHLISELSPRIFMVIDQNQLYFSTQNYIGQNHIYSMNLDSKDITIHSSTLNLVYGFAFNLKEKTLYFIENGRNGSDLIKLKQNKKSTILTGINFLGLNFNENKDLILTSNQGIYIIASFYL